MHAYNRRATSETQIQSNALLETTCPKISHLRIYRRDERWAEDARLTTVNVTGCNQIRPKWTLTPDKPYYINDAVLCYSIIKLLLFEIYFKLLAVQ